MKVPFGKILSLLKIRSKSSFVIELDKDSPDEDNVATVKDLRDMLAKCPRNARVAFGVNEDGNMRLLIDSFLHYNRDLNEVVLFPFNRPSVPNMPPIDGVDDFDDEDDE